MGKLLHLLKMFRGYGAHIVGNIIFNILSVIFSLFSILMIIPFLEILFGQVEQVLSEPTFSLTVNGVRDYLYYYLGHLKNLYGPLSALLFICGIVLITSFLKNLFRFLALFTLTPAKNGAVRDLRNKLYDKAINLPVSYYTEKSRGDIIARMSTDLLELEWSVINLLEVFVKEPATIIIYLTAMFLMSPLLTIYTLLLIPVGGAIIGLLGRRLKHRGHSVQEYLGSLINMIEETLSGLKIIKAFGAEQYQTKHFEAENERHYKMNVWLQRRKYLASPLTEFLGTLMVVIILYIGAKMVLGGSSLEAGVFIGYLMIMAQLINPAKAFSDGYYKVQKGIASSERIDQLLDADIHIYEKENPVELIEFTQGIRYENVSFAYEDAGVLNGIDVYIPKGNLVALVGASGSGKSTFVDLLPRFYDVKSGKITIDGQDIRDVKLSDLRSLLGIVTQQAILFDDTVFYNIAFGRPDATKEEVVAAARVANAHEFITQMEHGYETRIGHGGGKLSGGERQRITIARAVLKNPEILILDEATSALDSASEKLVQDALFKLLENRTAIVIAHRLSTIQHADEILVMQEGKIVERGKHQQLLDNQGVYARMVEIQGI